MSGTAAGQTTALTYDPLGRLWQVVKGSANTRFLYDGDQLAAEYDGSGVMARRYFFGPGEDAPVLDDPGSQLACTNGTKFLHADQQGSIVGQADCWGTRTNVNTYDEYGVPGSANVGRFQYTGQAWLSELALYYYKARLYDPRLGRFLQVDPVGYEGGINLYAYVEDDPVNGADPTGTVCVAGSLGNAGSIACLRAIYYSRIASDPKISAKTTFFSAASAVVNALASANLPFSFVSRTTRDFLEESGERLAAANIARANRIGNGSLYGGGSTIAQNDREFVRFEQGLMQNMLDAFRNRDPTGYSNTISEVNGLLNGSVREGIGSMFGAEDKNVRSAIDYVRARLGRYIDFSKMSDRVAIGDRVTSMLRAGTTMCTGTRLRVC